MFLRMCQREEEILDLGITVGRCDKGPSGIFQSAISSTSNSVNRVDSVAVRFLRLLPWTLPVAK